MDLQLLCSNEPGRESISRPWSAGDWTFATDGRILVRVPRINTEDKYKPLKLELFKFGHDAVPEEAWVDGGARVRGKNHAAAVYAARG